jgi:hypothetical protein
MLDAAALGLLPLSNAPQLYGMAKNASREGCTPV